MTRPDNPEEVLVDDEHWQVVARTRRHGSNALELLGDDPVDLVYFLGTSSAEDAPPAALSRCFGCLRFQVRLEGRGHEVLEAFSAKGRGRLGSAKEIVGDFERGSHCS
jgi:hypothetical protein